MQQIDLPERPGERPETTDTNPHSQTSQTPPPELYDAIAERMFGLPDTKEGLSRVSVPGTRAIIIESGADNGPEEAFLAERECCHLHARDDGSLHMALPPAVANRAIEQGWAEAHPVAEMGLLPETIVLVYGPRNEEDLEIVFSLVETSYQFARGTYTSP